MLSISSSSSLRMVASSSASVDGSFSFPPAHRAKQDTTAIYDSRRKGTAT